MALQIGDASAGSGLAGAIYDQLDAVLSPPLADDEATLAAAQDGWRNLALAIATGVVEHLVANLEVRGVQTTGSVSAPVANGVAVQSGVLLTQSNDGTGRVR
jgi:hypothetical protein